MRTVEWMSKPVPITYGILLVLLAASCRATVDNATTTHEPTSSCLSTMGEGTVDPAIAIHSITILANDAELVLLDGDALPVGPGTQVRVLEVTICVGPFSTSGGEVCVDFAPTDPSGEEIATDPAGTHLVQVTPGLITLPGPDRTWIIDDAWAGMTAVVNHWPGVKTRDRGCADRACEHDDRLLLPFR
jgi:hypothetical protein